MATSYQTKFGSLKDYEKGRLDIINDEAKHYAFSNVFEVANNSAPYEKVAVARNREYVLEAIRAEGTSEWRVASHDEFVLCMDGQVTIELHKAGEGQVPPKDKKGSLELGADPAGPRMGRIIVGRGHQALLPAGAAYRFHCDDVAALIMQTIEGDGTVYKWREIVATEL
ncbi:MAG: hydroxyquinol 1,2-dioxygenase [Actinobacteria bacterium]|nr:hydroxyquinol 1,2-dioxygenase [Actinomycetota bacterium]